MVADARERAVLPFIEAEFQAHAFVVKQVTTADYLICRHGAVEAVKAVEAAEAAEAVEAVVLAAVERKTHADFAASFKDGRHENIKKMLALRAATGCKLYYFVEGPAFPATAVRFGGIPFGNILAAMTRMMVCDDIFVVQTESAAHSARRLADFVRAFDATALRGATPAAACLAVPGVLTARADETDGEAAVCMWARLAGVSVVTGKALTRAFTVAELAAREVTPEQVRAVRTETGRPINQEAAESLLGVRDGSHAVLLVSGLRGITPAVARLLLDATGGLARLCADPRLAAVRLPQKTRSVAFGTARAGRVQRVLNYKAPPGKRDGEMPASLAALRVSGA